jgi:hypothetical protein
MRKSARPFLYGGLIFFLGLAAGWVVWPAVFHAAGETRDHVSILEGIPDVRQSTTYSCGAAALQAILSYWGIDKQERALMDELKTSEETGTSPDNIIRVAKEMGLEAYLKEGLDLEDLEESIKRGIPVIAAIQAWVEPQPPGYSWEKDWEDGHYVIIIGLDSRNVYVEDPSLLGTKGLIPRQEFLERWHDYSGAPPLDPSDRVYNHLGIFVIGKSPARQAEFSRVQ